LLLLACLTPIQIAQASGFSLETSQQIYRPGDTVLVTADLYNEQDSIVEVVLQCLLTSRTKMASDRPVWHTATLGAGESKVITLYQIDVTEDFPSDQYIVSVTLIEDNIIEEEREITFLVEGTLKQMPFTVHLCRDEQCEYEASVFIQGDNIYAGYESPIEGIQVAGTLIFPDSSKEDMTLPAVLQATETGSYILRVNASKEGYKGESAGTSFAVIEQEPNIPVKRPPWVAIFTVTDLQVSPIQAVVGEMVVISANVTNTGGAEGSCNVTLKKNGTMEGTSEVNLMPGQSTRVSFNCTEDSPGDYQVEIDGRMGSFIVSQAPVRWWIIAAVVGGVVVLGAGIVAYRARRKNHSS